MRRSGILASQWEGGRGARLRGPETETASGICGVSMCRFLSSSEILTATDVICLLGVRARNRTRNCLLDCEFRVACAQQNGFDCGIGHAGACHRRGFYSVSLSSLFLGACRVPRSVWILDVGGVLDGSVVRRSSYGRRRSLRSMCGDAWGEGSVASPY